MKFIRVNATLKTAEARQLEDLGVTTQEGISTYFYLNANNLSVGPVRDDDTEELIPNKCVLIDQSGLIAAELNMSPLQYIDLVEGKILHTS